MHTRATMTEKQLSRCMEIIYEIAGNNNTNLLELAYIIKTNIDNIKQNKMNIRTQTYNKSLYEENIKLKQELKEITEKYNTLKNDVHKKAQKLINNIIPNTLNKIDNIITINRV